MPLFQSESKCETILKMTDLHENETACRTHFHMKGFAFWYVLKQWHKGTRKWAYSVLASKDAWAWHNLWNVLCNLICKNSPFPALCFPPSLASRGGKWDPGDKVASIWLAAFTGHVESGCHLFFNNSMVLISFWYTVGAFSVLSTSRGYLAWSYQFKRCFDQNCAKSPR